MVGQLSLFDFIDNCVSDSENVIAPFVSGGEVNISRESWDRILEKNTKEKIIADFLEEILSGRIILPLRKITRQEMVNSFRNLMAYQCNEYMHGQTYSRYEYSKPISDTYISETTVGNMASDYFHQLNRFKTGSINSPSPVRTWNNEKFLKGALGSLFSMKHQLINTATLRSCLSLRKYVASQFKPAVAKSIYEKFGSRYVLDFSSGWGDRLCGFFATENTKHYVGIDPNIALVSGYVSQIMEYSNIVSEKNATMVCLPAEDVLLEKDSFDTVFTSPPYFNIERYSDDPSQSYKRYKSIDNWLNGFLFKSIKNAWYALQKGGHMIINVSDVYAGHKINNICDPMNEYIASLGGEYVGCIGMKMSKRPNSKAASQNGKVFVEPIWIWKKQ